MTGRCFESLHAVHHALPTLAIPTEQAAENVRALMDSLPPMRPLVMVLKVFLQQRELNEVRVVGFAV